MNWYILFHTRQQSNIWDEPTSMASDKMDGKTDEYTDEQKDRNNVNVDIVVSEKVTNDMLYGVEDVPWPPMMLLFGLQVGKCYVQYIVLHILINPR